MRAEDDAPTPPSSGDRGRRYFVTLEDGPPLDVTVVDREQQAQGFFYRVWRRLTLRGITTRRSLQSLRQALEQEALLAYAAIAAGANAPKLIATSELGPDAVMLVYEHIGGRTLDSLPDEEITDELLRDAWQQVQALQSRRIAHRRLAGDAILVDRSGKVILTDLRGGEIAAGDLVLRMDIAQLLTTLGLRVGAERAVAVGGRRARPGRGRRLPAAAPAHRAEPLHPRDAAQARPGAGRSASGRRCWRRPGRPSRPARRSTGDGRPTPGKADKKAVRAEKQAEKRAIDEALEEAREEDLLTQIRQQVLLIRPQAPVEPARLERIRPRTLVSFIAGAFAAYFLLSQLTHIEFGTLIGKADWGWVGRGRALLRAELLRGGDEPAGLRAGAGAVPADRGRAGRRVVREDRRAGGGRRCRAQHPLPAARGGAAGARGGERRRLAAVRARLPHPAAAVLRLSDRYREDAVAVAVPDGHRGSADGRGAGAGGDRRSRSCGSSSSRGCGRCSRVSCRACWTCCSGRRSWSPASAACCC